MTTPIVLTMKFSQCDEDYKGGTWLLLDAEENEVGKLCGWVAEQLGGSDYSGQTEYMVIIESEVSDE